ncbi:MAG: hypothetical protein BWK77_05765 [Verrucomicrobia bacterium A1]|nr:MAG: hypothetical protein BWK77_05765 [Verrucomicrobia bacterium A1]
MRYWDSSAIIPLLVRQPLSEGVRGLALADPDTVTWWGTEIECRSALARLRREDAVNAKESDALHKLLADYAAAWTEIRSLDGVRDRAARLLTRHPLRAADALQLAAALMAADGDPSSLPFVCTDHRLRAAAAAEGFEVLP